MEGKGNDGGRGGGGEAGGKLQSYDALRSETKNRGDTSFLLPKDLFFSGFSLSRIALCERDVALRIVNDIRIFLSLL